MFNAFNNNIVDFVQRTYNFIQTEQDIFRSFLQGKYDSIVEELEQKRALERLVIITKRIGDKFIESAKDTFISLRKITIRPHMALNMTPEEKVTAMSTI